jgi:hypothetical protein
VFEREAIKVYDMTTFGKVPPEGPNDRFLVTQFEGCAIEKFSILIIVGIEIGASKSNHI